MSSEWIHTRLESFLDRAFDLNNSTVHLSGISSTAPVAFFLSQTFSKNINRLPHLVVVSSSEQAERLQTQIEFFDPQRICHILPAFDVSPYSGLYPNPVIQQQRIEFLVKAQHAVGGEIFIAPIQSLLQKTLPFKELSSRVQTFRVGDELPSSLAEHFVDLGYTSAPLVEDRGQFAIRGGIVDIFSTGASRPIRIELFGDQIESLRYFNPSDQRSSDEIKSFILAPATEYLFSDDTHERLLKSVRAHFEGRKLVQSEVDEILRSLVLKMHFPGMDFLLPFFFEKLESPLNHFNLPLNLWLLDHVDLARQADEFWAEAKSDFQNSTSAIRPEPQLLFELYDSLPIPEEGRKIDASNLEYLHEEKPNEVLHSYRSASLVDFANIAQSFSPGSDNWLEAANKKVSRWKEDGFKIFIAVRNQIQFERLAQLLEKMQLQVHRIQEKDFHWDRWYHEQGTNEVHLLPRYFNESIKIDEEQIIFLRDDDFFGRKQRVRESASKDFQKQAQRLSFGDLKPGDLVVHVKHGIGVYEGLKIMDFNGAQSEYIQVGYKDKDKLYLPVYRVSQLQKYSGAAAHTTVLDKLGGVGWEKTKSKVKSHLRDIAAELLKLYAERAQMHREAFEIDEIDYLKFEKGFPYEETPDQLRAIEDIAKDLESTKPMDRLICGDVGFGKTEVAMRAAFFAYENLKQVAVLAPTTVLTFQHFETFKRRFAGLPIEIRALNRFVTTTEAKKTLQELKDGKVHLLIGTHRILSKDVEFKDLGLLIIDEEQKFGVTHKEKIRKLKTSVDTLTMSATPIPRTLNMAFTGIRDLSIINTAPVDRLPTRTFVCKFEPETIRKAILAEISRGGQIYFIHNRVQSIYGLADELRQIVPEARMKVAHGQMSEDELEQAMLAFFNHEIDLLVCTAIVESGMDVPRANTMFIDQAQLFGLSQLYQLRGRVGRSKSRAYCYLLMPKDRKLDADAQERLKIIQDNSALGSGIKIAQYDLELRGSGNLLGDDQSGHVNSVGYEMYMDLLNEALADAKGESIDDRELDPEVNLRIPALIPESYIPDIRIRLSYYKALAQIESTAELDKIEDELKDQFGAIPEPTLNLMGLMLIRRQCKELGVRDISAGLKTVSLIFTERTKLTPDTVIKLAMRENKKYAVTPNNRFNIRMNSITWTAVYEELNYLLKMI